MTCPTCDHTTACLTGAPGFEFFHCERCGTVVRMVAGKVRDTYVPKLVERCRQIGATLGPAWRSLWHRLSIAESINVPAERISP